MLHDATPAGLLVLVVGRTGPAHDPLVDAHLTAAAAPQSRTASRSSRRWWWAARPAGYAQVRRRPPSGASPTRRSPSIVRKSFLTGRRGRAAGLLTDAASRSGGVIGILLVQPPFPLATLVPNADGGWTSAQLLPCSDRRGLHPC